MKTVLKFIARRKQLTNEFYPYPGSRRTVLVASHAGWTELAAHAVWKSGFNVLVAEPWSAFFEDEERFVKLDNVFRRWVETLRKFNVQLVIGGNQTAMLPHPKTKEPLHRAAGVPAVHYWAEDPRTMPAMTRRGYTAGDYLACLRDPRTLNVFWNLDVQGAVQRFLAVANVAHVPVGTTPELWQTAPGPAQERPIPLCFVGDNALPVHWLDGQRSDTVAWAERVAALKLADPDRPLIACVDQVGGPGESRGSTARRPYELAPTLAEEFQRWEVLNAVLLRDGRDPIIAAAAERYGDRFAAIGRGWERLGVHPRAEQTPAEGPAELYAKSRASLNPSDGWAARGSPFRAGEIVASGGLLFTQYDRELPQLFDPGRECVAFRNRDEMLAACERIEASPAEFDALVENGRRRLLAEHTWEHRMARVLQLAKERFDLPW